MEWGMYKNQILNVIMPTNEISFRVAYPECPGQQRHSHDVTVTWGMTVKQHVVTMAIFRVLQQRFTCAMLEATKVVHEVSIKCVCTHNFTSDSDLACVSLHVL